MAYLSIVVAVPIIQMKINNHIASHSSFITHKTFERPRNGTCKSKLKGIILLFIYTEEEFHG
jgi:hypothetical protein